MMKMVSRTASSSLTCRIDAAKKLRFRTDVNCDLLPESVGYAVCRFLRSSPALRHSLVSESYKLRLAQGKARRMLRRSVVAPAALMELPGSWAQVSLTITPAGVEVNGVRLCEEYPHTTRR